MILGTIFVALAFIDYTLFWLWIYDKEHQECLESRYNIRKL